MSTPINSAVDAPRPVRPGEEIDAAPLAVWLKERLPGVEGPIAIEQFPGGHSNLTYLLRFGDRELVLRRPPFGSKVKTAHDMGREFRVLPRLYTLYPKAPQALLHCDDPEVIGAPFYIMERVRGIILRQQRPVAGIDLHPERMRAISEAAVDGLAELHAVDYRAAGLDDLGHPEGYVARQVAGWSERWRRSRTDDLPDLDRAAAWLADHQPPEKGAALLHNDYKYDNLVLHPEELERIVAVLDWEMATVGDPLMDLGTSLGYWMDPDDAPALRLLPAGPTTLPGNLRRVEVVERYANITGRDVSGILFYYVYGLFKIAVIAQQIYYRYQQGLTKDERFAALIGAVRILGHTAAQAIDKGRIDRLDFPG
ncbi:MAG TPA: phosphotransferase family protein [Thermoanaerobaculia bacterium]|jgi:aminoglycoside phosphotransferase (APT) family kinase protein|nr:phosphotransferase family protein [Thermoanaerobaculia bacterium]